MRQIAIVFLICLLAFSAMHQIAAEEDAPSYQPADRPLSNAELIEYSAKLEAMIVPGWEAMVDIHKANCDDVVASALGVDKAVIKESVRLTDADSMNASYSFINLYVCTAAALLRRESRDRVNLKSLFFARYIDRVLDTQNTPFLDMERGEYFARARELLIRPEYMIPLETEIIRRSEALPIGEGAIEERISQWAALFNDDPIQDGALMHWLFTKVRGEEITEPYEGIIDRCKYNRLEFTAKYTRKSILALELAQKPRSILNARLMVHLWPTLEKYSVNLYSSKMCTQIMAEATFANYFTIFGSFSAEVWKEILPLYLVEKVEQSKLMRRMYLRRFALSEQQTYETGACWFATDIIIDDQEFIKTSRCVLYPIIQLQVPTMRRDAMKTFIEHYRSSKYIQELLLGASGYFDNSVNLKTKEISAIPSKKAYINVDIDVMTNKDVLQRAFEENAKLFLKGLGNYNPSAITGNNYTKYMIPRIFVHFPKTKTQISSIQQIECESDYRMFERSLLCMSVVPDDGAICDKVMLGFVIKHYNNYPDLCGSLQHQGIDAMIWNAYEFVKDTNNEFLLNEFKKFEVQLVETSIERWNECYKRVERLRNGEEW